MGSEPLAVTAERIRVLYGQAGPVLAANLINGGLMMAALRGGAEQWRLTVWGSGLALLILLRAGLYMLYRQSDPADAKLPAWGRRYTAGSALSGALWGSTAVLFLQGDDPLSLMLVSFVIGGMAAGAMTGLASHLPAFYAFLALSVLPLVGRLMSLGDRLHLIMGAMMTVFVIAMLVIGRSYNRSLTRGLQLAEENRRLLASRESEVRARTADLVAANSRLRDEIVERQRAERALDEARAVAVCANQAKSRFLAAASHDLRQPMQSMFLFCQAIRYHVPDDKGRAALLMLERGLNTLRDLLDSLLDVSRLDVNVTRPKLAGFPLRPLLGEIVDAYGPIAATKGLQVGIAPMPEVHVTSDRNLLGRMVRNLVENAIRYTERGQVMVACRSIDGKLRIEVRDTGIGIPAEQLGRIFEEFHQVANPERDKSRGLGLGLAIVQRLSVILGHRVEVRSELGKGSVFSIELDLAAGASAAPGLAADEADGDVDIGQQGQGKMIVVVDDDPMVLLGLRDVLERWGYEVVSADGADQALAMLGSPARRPALVVADYRLRSGRVGTEAIERIRALSGAAVPGIILTGETGDECRNEASQHGFDLLHKPVSSHQLAFVLKNLAGG